MKVVKLISLLEQFGTGDDSAPQPVQLNGHCKEGFHVALCGTLGSNQSLAERLHASSQNTV